MRISYNKISGMKHPTFSNLSMGEVFILLSDENENEPLVYMVTDNYEEINAVCLNDGETCFIDERREVIPLETSLVISRRLS